MVNDTSPDITNRKLAGFLGAGEIITLCVGIGVGLMAFQSLASSQEHQQKEMDAGWERQESNTEDITSIKVDNAEIKATVKSHTKTLERIERNGDKMMQMMQSMERARISG